MRRIQRLACDSIGAVQGGIGSCDVHDPRPASAPWLAPGRGRGWCGEEDDPDAGVADVWGLVCQLVLMRRRAVRDG